MIAVGDILIREDGHRFRLIGVHNGDWVAEPLDAFGPPVNLTARELASGFGVDSTDPPAADTQSGWRVLADAAEDARRGEVPHEPQRLPEDVFAEANAAAEAEAKAKQPKRRRNAS